MLLRSAWRSSPAALANRITSGEFERPPHINYINRDLVDVTFERCDRLMVEVPVRHGKSTLIDHWYPVWHLSLFPHDLIMLGSYEADFAAGWGRKVRNTIDEFGGVLGITLAPDSKAAGRWNTPQGGGMVTGGLDSGFTGRGAKVMIFDDLIKNAEVAHSMVIRDKIMEFIRSTAISRLEPGGAAIVTNARWHEDDHLGRIKRGEFGNASRWKFIRLPALAEVNDPLGRTVGEALWPKRYSAAALAEIRLEVGEYYWQSLYQQSPPSVGGDLAYGSFDATEGRNIDSGVRLLDELPLQLSIDFNRNPGMHGVIGQHWKHEDLAIARYVLHSPRMTIKQMIGRMPGSSVAYPGSFLELVKRFRGWPDNGRPFPWPWLEVFGDATGTISQMGDGKRYWDIVAEELQAAGIPYKLRVPRSNPGVVDSLLAINAAFCTPDGRYRYKVHPECTLLINDFKYVKADGDGLSKKDELLSHSCLVAGTMVETDAGPRPIELIQVGDLVVTRSGLRPVIRAWQSSPAANTFTVRVSNGSEITCTGNHPVWVNGSGFVFANKLRTGDAVSILYPSGSELKCEANQSSIVASNIPVTRNRAAARFACITWLVMANDCIGAFTKTTLGRFRRATTFIIGMTTRLIIGQTILKRWWDRSIAGFIPAGQSILQGSKKHCQPLVSRLQNGTRAKKGGRWLGNWPSKPDLAIIRLIRNAISAGESLLPCRAATAMYFVPSIARWRQGGVQELTTYPEPVSSAARNFRSTNTGRTSVAPVVVERVTENQKPEPVYDLTVEGAHEFYANGILVKNSDCERYRMHYIMPIRRTEFGGGRVTTAEDVQAA